MKSLSTTERKKIYGSFAYTVNADNTINIKGTWERDNVVTVLVPQLKGIPTYGGVLSGKIRWHKKGVEQLQGFWAEVEKKKLMGDVLFWGGSYFPRKTRNGAGLSSHAWATAFDINPDQNPYKKPYAPVGRVGSVVRLVPIAYDWGFAWGGDWTTYTDGMHFELAGLKPKADIPLEGPSEARTATLRVVGGGTVEGLILRENRAYGRQTDLALAIGIEVFADREVAVGEYLDFQGYKLSFDKATKVITAVRK